MRCRRDVVLQALQRLGRAAVDARGRAGRVARARRRRSCRGASSARWCAAGGEELLRPQEQRLRRQDRPLAVVAGGSDGARACRPRSAAAPRRSRRAARASRRRRGSRTGSRSRRRTAAGRTRCPRWRCRCRCPCRYATLVGSPSKRSRQRARKRVARGLVHRELAAGQQANLGHRIEASLRVGIEGADRIDLVAEQVDAVGQGRAHREQVDQPAAHRVLARRDDLAHVGVAGERELRLERRLVEALLGREVEGVAGHERRRREADERRRRRHQDDVDVAAPDSPERGQPLGDQVLVRRERVVGQRLPVGEDGNAERGAKNGISSASRCASAGSAVKIATTLARARSFSAKRASRRASAEPGGRGSAKRLPGAMSGRSMKAAGSRMPREAKPRF